MKKRVKNERKIAKEKRHTTAALQVIGFPAVSILFRGYFLQQKSNR
jgi:hypothetical protein